MTAAALCRQQADRRATYLASRGPTCKVSALFLHQIFGGKDIPLDNPLPEIWAKIIGLET